MKQESSMAYDMWRKGGFAYLRYSLRLSLVSAQERMALYIVWRLPRWLIYWSGIRLWAEYTTRYPTVEVPSVVMNDAIKDWRK